MRRQRASSSIILIAALALLGFSVFLLIQRGETVHAATKLLLTATSTLPSSSSNGLLDSTIIAAYISLAGVLLTIAITLFVAIRSERLQRKLALRNEQLQRELIRQSEQYQREQVRLQKEVEREYALREQQERQKDAVSAAEMRRKRMLGASTN